MQKLSPRTFFTCITLEFIFSFNSVERQSLLLHLTFYNILTSALSFNILLFYF